jgi:hypothetical protein
MSDLAEFLLARIAEDEATDMGLPHRGDCRIFGGWPGAPDSFVGCDCGLSTRVLAECEAKRQIVELHAGDAPICMDGFRPGLSHEGLLHSQSTNGVPDGYCDTVRALAAVYADHPDYQ